MSDRKLGRNDPCPCGSGKKYKACHLRSDEAQARALADADPRQAVPRALAWLDANHRRSLQSALDDLIEDAWPDEADAPGPAEIDDDSWTGVLHHLTEWLVAEGAIEIDGEWRDIAELLLNEAQDRLSEVQRAWIAQLVDRPLRLYVVTAVAADPLQPGRVHGLTLVDALGEDDDPITVTDMPALDDVVPGLLIGCRLMDTEAGLAPSDAVFVFSEAGSDAARALVGAVASGRPAPARAARPPSGDVAHDVGIAIVSAWLVDCLGYID